MGKRSLEEAGNSRTTRFILTEPERFLTRNREVSITRPPHCPKRRSRHPLNSPEEAGGGGGVGRERRVLTGLAQVHPLPQPPHRVL